MMKKMIPVFVLLLIVLGSCGSNHISSSAHTSAAERISVLKRHILCRSELLDAEYDIFDNNLNTTLIPGPTERDYKMALLVNHDDIGKWIDDSVVITSFPVQYDWVSPLIRNNDNFVLLSSPSIYTSKEKTMFVFEKEGVILIRVLQR